MDRQLKRRLVQVIVFVFVLLGVGTGIAYIENFDMGYFSWICPFFYLQGGFIWASNFTGPWLILLGVVLGLTLVGGLLTGRLFCSWICPFGTILDAAGVVKDDKEKMEMPEFLTDRVFKYGILLGFLVSAIVLARPAFCDVCPAGAFYRSVGPVSSAGIPVWMMVPWAVSGVALIFAAFYDTRAWCKYLCPLGAFLSFFDKYTPDRFRAWLPHDKCIECFKCEKVCPMDIKTVKLTKWSDERYIKSGECIRCYACNDACPMKHR